MMGEFLRKLWKAASWLENPVQPRPALMGDPFKFIGASTNLGWNQKIQFLGGTLRYPPSTPEKPFSLFLAGTLSL